MRNFSISCATARADRRRRRRLPFVAAALALALLVSAPLAAKKRAPAPEDLMNPLLGLDYSHWLVGPIGAIADEDERDEYLALTSDAEAERFIAAFWERRAEDTPVFTATPRQVYEARVEAADGRFTEGAFPGHRTARGGVFVLHGEPEEVEFRSPDRIGDPVLEVWRYAKDAEPGLDGAPPEREYRFVDDGGSMTFYDGRRPPDPLRGKRPGRGRGFHR